MRTLLTALLVLCFSHVVSAQTGIVFSGTDVPPNLTGWAWGQSTLEVEQGGGPDHASNALKWVQGDEWGGGWTGVGFSVDPAFDLSPYWQHESVTFRMKCDTGVGAMRVQYESAAGKTGIVFTPEPDTLWHVYTFPCRSMVYQDGSTGFDSAAVNTVGIMAEATGKVGKVIYITDWHVTTQPSILLFNGIAIPTNIEPWTWGNSQIEVMPGAGTSTKANALKWTEGDVQTGFGFTISPVADLSKVWMADSMRFTVKAGAGTDTVTIMLYDAAYNIIGKAFTVKADDQWHEYFIPLRELLPFDIGGTFDTAKINFAEVNVGIHGGKGVPGRVMYFTDWWTGNPIFDVMPPSAPTTLNIASQPASNHITWTDVEGEQQERYNLYYSKNPITDVSKADVVAVKIAEGVQAYDHALTAPVTDQQVAYYYAITCTDAAGNVSEPFALASAHPNLAKGIATISLSAPTSTFNADGDLTEWAAIKPIHMAPSGGGYVVTGTTITNDADLSLDAYVAVDKTYLYVAFDVEDDIVSTTGETWANDCPDIYLGLYNWHGAKHANFKRGAEPDYHLRFASDRIIIDNLANGDSLMVPGKDYFWAESFPTGYVVEARIPWTLLAERGGDSVFVPVEGDRIPMDFDIIDSDAPGAREGILCYAVTNDANSWSSPTFWSHTWIGSLFDPATGVKNNADVAMTYSLTQNYPNPFNPATQIKYSLAKPGMVSVKIFDVLGREVKEIFHQQQGAGEYTLNFNAAGISSGVYFYQLTAGDFHAVKKMVLMK